jgi:hypothetical protein
MGEPTSSSVTPKSSQSSTPILPPCSVPYRWILHVGRCVNVYFDPIQPAAVWCEHQHPEIQILYFGPGSDCTVYWSMDNDWHTGEQAEREERHVAPAVKSLDVPYECF